MTTILTPGPVTHSTHSTHSTQRRRTSVQMVTPAEAGAALCLSAEQLLDAVNHDLLPAYDLGGAIRFRASDVAAVAARLILDRDR
ncbi:MAG: hypothetical protein AAF567_09850 [Actinomycetota bacterium]